MSCSSAFLGFHFLAVCGGKRARWRTRALVSGSNTAQVGFNRSYSQYQLPKVTFNFMYSSKGEGDFRNVLCRGISTFLQGYGVGMTYLDAYTLGPIPQFRNELTPISATIAGKEIVYEQVRPLIISRAPFRVHRARPSGPDTKTGRI